MTTTVLRDAFFALGRYVAVAALVALAALPAAAPVSAKERVVRVAATDFPPYQMAEPVDGLRGFDTEVVEEALRRAGLRPLFEFYPWNRAVHLAASGTVEMVFSCADTPERREAFHLSAPISHFTSSVLVRRDYAGPDIVALGDLAGLRVAVVLGYTAGKKAVDAGALPVEAYSDAEALRKLREGLADAFYTPEEAVSFLLRGAPDIREFRWFRLRSETFHLCVSKASPRADQLLEAFDAQLAAMRADGALERIHARYRPRIR